MKHFIEKSGSTCNHFNCLRMKFAVLIILLIVASLGVHAGDVSCQSEIMKPKISAVHVMDEDQKPADLTVAEAKLRLKENNELQASDEEEQIQQDETAQVESKKVTAKKQSRLGGIFDILLPSKLRNPVK